MTSISTRSNTNFKQTSINQLLLPSKKNKTKEKTMSDDEGRSMEMDGHELNDHPDPNQTTLTPNSEQQPQPSQQTLQQSQTTRPQQPPPKAKLVLEKFDGQGDAEQWLKKMLKECDNLQLNSVEKHTMIQEFLTSNALVWYAKEANNIPNFVSFIREFLRQYGKIETETIQSNDDDKLSSTIVAPIEYEEVEVEENRPRSNPICNQMLLHNADKLTRFSGKTKQNVSKWLREFEQTMLACKLSEEDKLTVVSSWLESDARDWFFDNLSLFTSWKKFTDKLLKTFESSGKSDIAFHRLRHYEQTPAQDVRQYYFEIIKLCKEANPKMDEESKLQYLKDGLKPSLRFDILLKDPKTPEDFLEYAQRIEELKSLDDRQLDPIPTETNTNQPRLPSNKNNNINNNRQTQSFTTNSSSNQGDNRMNRNLEEVPAKQSNNYEQNNSVGQRPPYRCYNCQGTDHYYRNCPHFQ